MQAMDGYQRAALSLQELEESERHWLLDQLSADDRERIRAAFASINNAAGVAGASRKSSENASVDDVDAIHQWETSSLLAVLNDEPNWVVVALMQSVDAVQMDEIVHRLPPLRGAEIRELLQHVEQPLKPSAKKAVLHSVVDKAKRRRITLTAKSVFEAALQRAASAQEK